LASSSASLSATLSVRTVQVISVPPEVMLTQDVSGRRANASATGSDAEGAQRTRRNHSTAPNAVGSTPPSTRTTPAARSRAYRRAMVRSDTPRTSAIVLNGARPLTCRACTSRRSSSS